MISNNIKYSAQIKNLIVDYYITNNISYREISEIFKINSSTIRNWIITYYYEKIDKYNIDTKLQKIKNHIKISHNKNIEKEKNIKNKKKLYYIKLKNNLTVIQTPYNKPGEKNRKVKNLLDKNKKYVYYYSPMDKYKKSNTQIALRKSKIDIKYCNFNPVNVLKNLNRTIILSGLKTNMTHGIKLYEEFAKNELNKLPKFCHIFVVGGTCLPLGIISGLSNRKIHIHVISIIENHVSNYKFNSYLLYRYYNRKSFDEKYWTKYVHYHSIKQKYGEKLSKNEKEIKKKTKLMLDDVYTLRTYIQCYEFAIANPKLKVYFFNSYSNK